MIQIETDGFLFKFEDAINVFKFDEPDRSQSTFHGAPMKAVDIIAEFENEYIFVEIKNFDDPSIYNVNNINSSLTADEEKGIRDSFKWLKNYLKYKYRDSFLYRYAENKVDKDIIYICLLSNFDGPLNNHIRRTLMQELPIRPVPSRWEKSIAKTCHVLNLEQWNRNYPKWQVQPSNN
jgi:hypothetical protein